MIESLTLEKRGSRNRGLSKTPEYISWRGMLGRCLNPKANCYADYGGRGIKVCQSWIDSFEVFRRDVGPRPPGTLLDRIDNDGHYEPGNVRWVTREENQRNRSDNRRLTYRGETLTLIEWAERLGVNYNTLSTRLNKLKWTIDRVLGEPVR